MSQANGAEEGIPMMWAQSKWSTRSTCWYPPHAHLDNTYTMFSISCTVHAPKKESSLTALSLDELQRLSLPVDSVVELDRGVSCEVAELPEVRCLADLNKIRHKYREHSVTEHVTEHVSRSESVVAEIFSRTKPWSETKSRSSFSTLP